MNRQEIINELNELIHDSPVRFPVEAMTGLKDALAYIEGDGPLVRCKDCKHYKGGKCWNVMRRYGLHDDFFCADGKAKDGEQE